MKKKTEDKRSLHARLCVGCDIVNIKEVPLKR